jgi:peptide/nickel transport system substrate-binding protein
MKKLSVICVWVCLLLLVMVGLPLGAQDDEPITLRLGTTYMIDTLNPTNGFYGYTIRPLWYDTLIEWAGGNRFEPGLAESWSTSDDGLTWTFNIREGVTFHDGMPLTAVEVAWNINWIIANKIPSVIGYMVNITSAEALDATTLQINLSAPAADMISAKFVYTWILPPHIWEDKTGEDITTFADLEATIGSGPYRLVEYQEGEFMVMEANPNYLRGAPPVDRLIYQEFANDDAMVQALLAGDIDLIVTTPATGVLALQNSEEVEITTAPGFAIEELIINSSPDGTQPASLNDPIIREAIARAVDKEQIINVGHLGFGEPGTTVLPRAMGDFHNSLVRDLAFNLDRANALLDEAGYLDSDGDGIREYSDGTPLQYRFYAPESLAHYARVAEIISADLAEIGIDAPVTILSDDSLLAAQIDYDNDLIYWGWDYDPDPTFALSIFTCAETVDGGWSDSGYCNPEYDALFEAQASTRDVEERRRIIWEMQEMLFEDRPYIITSYLFIVSSYRRDRFTFSDDLASQLLKWALFNGFSVVE